MKRCNNEVYKCFSLNEHTFGIALRNQDDVPLVTDIVVTGLSNKLDVCKKKRDANPEEAQISLATQEVFLLKSLDNDENSNFSLSQLNPEGTLFKSLDEDK